MYASVRPTRPPWGSITTPTTCTRTVCNCTCGTPRAATSPGSSWSPKGRMARGCALAGRGRRPGCPTPSGARGAGRARAIASRSPSRGRNGIARTSAGASGSTSSSTRCFPAGSAGRGSSCGAAATAGCGCVETGRIRSGSGCWSWWDESNAECGVRNAELQGKVVRPATPTFTLRVPRSAFRTLFVWLMSVVVVLHEPQELVNIAHVVRALKNFGFRDLRLVRPREYDAFRVEGIAHQTQDILARVTQHERLEDALADCVHVVGFTSRGRSARRNQQRPRPAAAEILARSEVGVVALLFGREDKGLANDALDRCHRVVTIPTNPDYPSLNLAHAVVLMLYELALARGDESRAFKAPRRAAPPAPVADLERLFADRSEEHTSELQSPCNLVCRLLLEKKKEQHISPTTSALKR